MTDPPRCPHIIIVFNDSFFYQRKGIPYLSSTIFISALYIGTFKLSWFFFLIDYFFRVVLGSQKNLEAGTEISHKPLASTYAQPPGWLSMGKKEPLHQSGTLVMLSL